MMSNPTSTNTPTYATPTSTSTIFTGRCISLHFGPDEYKHLIGHKLGDLLIQNIQYEPDNVYNMTDGHAGNPHLLTLSDGKTFQFRNFQEAVDKYGDLTFSPPTIH